jgi:hypothetical protein
MGFAEVLTIQYKRKEHDEDEQTDEWNFTQFRTLEHLFSPTAGLFRTGIPAIDPEIHMRDIRLSCSKSSAMFPRVSTFLPFSDSFIVLSILKCQFGKLLI